VDLTDLATVRGVARRFGVRFRKHWGQNFLVDRATLDRLVAALDVRPDQQVVEVGPGLGVLTRELAATGARVTGIEIDPACVRALALTLKDTGVRIVQGDVLQQRLDALVPPPYRVVGNIPYSLTGALFPHLLDQPRPPVRIDVVVQEEVARRLAAPPGGWSLATLSVRVYGTARLAFSIPRTAFYPTPRVASALLQITPSAAPAVPSADLSAFFRFARPFFQARRKQLTYVMSRGLQTGREPASVRLLALGIKPARRAETLTLEEWRRLFESTRANWKADMMART